jgi:hypothetical protein
MCALGVQFLQALCKSNEKYKNNKYCHCTVFFGWGETKWSKYGRELDFNRLIGFKKFFGVY